MECRSQRRLQICQCLSEALSLTDPLVYTLRKSLLNISLTQNLRVMSSTAWPGHTNVERDYDWLRNKPPGMDVSSLSK